MVHLAGYTALTETHGDEHATELAVGFVSLDLYSFCSLQCAATFAASPESFAAGA